MPGAQRTSQRIQRVREILFKLAEAFGAATQDIEIRERPTATAISSPAQPGTHSNCIVIPSATLLASSISSVTRPTDQVRPACSRWRCIIRTKSDFSSSLAQGEMLLRESSLSSRGAIVEKVVRHVFGQRLGAHALPARTN